MLNGVLIVDKPGGMTSHDVVDAIRRIAGTRRVGHSGTLDPMAEGVLVICLGSATRIVQFLVGMDKVYTGCITLGAISSTYDAEGKITMEDRPIPGSVGVIREAMMQQVGEHIQVPPSYSAVKVAGRKLYEYARSGEAVPQKPRRVRIHRFDMVSYEPPDICFEAHVASGTYIRTMAHDLGLKLECGGFLSRLRRTRVGGFSIHQAIRLDELESDPRMLPACLLDLPEALSHMPKLTVLPDVESAIMYGRSFKTGDVFEFDGILNPGQPVLVLGSDGQALSIVKPEIEKRDDPPDACEELDMAIGDTSMLFKPVRVLVQPANS
jgi:tRNA pseudouridine55 synthase